MKHKIIDEILTKLKSDLDTTKNAAKLAYEAATHEESKPEDQYDTRGIEASYLAGAQAKRVAELERLISRFTQLKSAISGKTKQISIGSLIELETDKKRQHYFLCQDGGGIHLSVEGVSVNVVTPQSPLGDALLDRTENESFEVELNKGMVRKYRIVSFE